MALESGARPPQGVTFQSHEKTKGDGGAPSPGVRPPPSPHSPMVYSQTLTKSLQCARQELGSKSPREARSSGTYTARGEESRLGPCTPGTHMPRLHCACTCGEPEGHVRLREAGASVLA